MTDIDSRMEANGLPTKFDSTPNKPAGDHSTANAAATMSNSEVAPLVDLKQPVPTPLELSTLVQPAQPTPSFAPPESQSTVEATSAPHLNGNTSNVPPEPVTVTNGHKSPIAPEEIPLQSNSTTEPALGEVPITSSTQADISSSAATDQPLVTSILEPVAAPQPPVSDMRTSPHSDQLAPEAVAAIEERKHEEDNNADSTVLAESSPQTTATSLPVQASADSALPTPPVQSPPPAPEPAHAELTSKASALETTTPVVTAEKPSEPAPTPVVSAAAMQDTVMEDAPVIKAAREREEDEEMEEPAAKRVKTEDNTPAAESAEFKVPGARTTTSVESTSPGGSHIMQDGDDSVTVPRLNHMKKVISNLKKSNASAAFRLPVDYVTLNIPTYPTIVTNPMDLSMIDLKLKNNEYSSVRDFVVDFELIIGNCVLFNGKEHGVTQQAYKMQSSFNNQMAQLPPSTMQEPTKAEKKAMKLKTEPVRQAPPRRPSVTTPSTAKSPKATAPPSTPAFAPGPDGVPLIRRDSSLTTDRPKRAIVPPKRNSDFAGVRPKKKKYELQLRFCQEVLKEIASSKHWQFNQYFTHPVDPVALNIPTYFQVIKKPMDLGTIQNKLDGNQYEKARDFEEDVRLVFKNCYKFNPEGDFVNQRGHELEELFDRKWATKDDWIAAREPHSEPSEVEDNEDEEDASEEEDNDSEDDRTAKIKALQAQIEAMSKQMGELTQVKKAKKTPPTTSKKGSKSKSKKDKASATFPGLTKPKKEKKSVQKSKAEKERYVTFAEKQYISNGITMLPERQMQEALKIIQSSVPSLANSGENEIELDIEEVPNHALIKLLNHVKKYAGPPPDEPETRATESYAPPAAERSKKSKPMSKTEQEAQIAELKGKLGAYGGPVSPDASKFALPFFTADHNTDEMLVQSVETGGDSSDESADSEESEEE